jgi:aconitate hydratase
MATRHNLFNTLQALTLPDNHTSHYYSLPHLEKAGLGAISRLPVCLRIVLESVLRNCDGQRVEELAVRQLAAWQPQGERLDEIPFVVARVLLQDFTGVPLLVDLAAMRSAVARMGRDAALIEPLVPVHLVVDHSVQVDFANTGDALRRNMEMEVKRNRSRYQFLKWGTQAFNGFSVVPPGVGICHQVNLEHIANGVMDEGGLLYPDTVVGADSHTTMITGLGVVGWGVGGIEAEAGMLGQPIYFLTPDVLGVNLHGSLRPGVTATDLVLYVTQVLRRAGVVGKFVEFHGDGAASLTVPDRATIANMAPEYGATMGYFPPDEQTCRYLLATGRAPEHVETVRRYFQAQGLFGMPAGGAIDYTRVLDLDLAEVVPSVAGPKRPQDRIDLPQLGQRFRKLLHESPEAGGYGKPESEAVKRVTVKTGPRAKQETTVPMPGGGLQDPDTMPKVPRPLTSDKNTNPETEIEMMQNRPTPDRLDCVPPEEFPRDKVELRHGDVVIAAITSCTNTSNPGVMLAAGLLAKKAVERGLRVNTSAVKASLAPGSRVVTEYLTRTGLQPYLDALGFQTVGYGCTTCIGNSGPLEPHLEKAIGRNDLVVASVLSGNRNFEARVHQSVKANFLMSPPLVVAFALAGRVDIDLETEPLGHGDDGDVYLRDIWPGPEEVGRVLEEARNPQAYRLQYGYFAGKNPLWDEIPAPGGKAYEWDPASTYIQEPPYFNRFGLEPEPLRPLRNARPLAMFGDSITTDHISPAGAITANSPAGLYLIAQGVPEEDFNTYGARRGNDRVMVRGTFANVRIRNRMVPGVEGGVTLYQPTRERMSIYDAAIHYQAAGIPLVVIAGQEYGTGSSRDWAAKGTRLLGVRAAIAQSFERIHRSNLVQMGVLPCQFRDGETAQTLNLDGSEVYDLLGLEGELRPWQWATLVIRRADGKEDQTQVRLRLDTPIEVDYYRHGGILPFVLRQLLGKA